MAAPVTIVDDVEVIKGYDPKKLVAALKLDVKVDLSASVDWLADKYDRILGAFARATRQLPDALLPQSLPWRPQSLRGFLAHVPGDVELAWVSRERSTVSFEQMVAHYKGLEHLATIDDLARYCEDVRAAIIQFLKSGDITALNHIVNAHKGGNVTILELLNFSLRHATHHLKQLYWLIRNKLDITPQAPATERDMEGISTPTELFEMEN
jgi:uncharacterized damage-inducible protein DinB